MKILMVCLGNICRSPLAEGIMLQKIQTYALEWKVDSAGTSSWHIGEKPDSRSIDIAFQNKIDISNQRARQFKARDLDLFDIIFAMDQSNYQNIIKECKTDAHQKKVKLIMNTLNPAQNIAVPDPYYDNGFEKVFNMLDRACETFVKLYIK